MKLYGMGTSRSFRALWALEEAQLDFEYVPLEYGSSESGGMQSQAYLELNSQGKVPTLVDDDLIITESGAILNYLAARSDILTLIPRQDLKLRARYDEICCFILTDLEQPLWTNGKHRFALPEAQRVEAILKTTSW